jgi:hypothetical protein
MKIPPKSSGDELPVTPGAIDSWAAAGWVDLRTSNMLQWHERLGRILEETSHIDRDDSSSRENFPPDYWNHFESMPIGKIAAWIFTVEEKGARMKA